jgi:hypothetical protein
MKSLLLKDRKGGMEGGREGGRKEERKEKKKRKEGRKDREKEKLLFNKLPRGTWPSKEFGAVLGEGTPFLSSLGLWNLDKPFPASRGTGGILLEEKNLQCKRTRFSKSFVAVESS